MTESPPPAVHAVELRSARLLLRPVTVADAEALYAAIDASREHLRPWMTWVDLHRSADDTRRWCAAAETDWAAGTNLPFAVVDASTGSLLGLCGIEVRDAARRVLEVGYWLRAGAEGRGIMTEAVRLLIPHAFGPMRATRLELRCDAANERSRRVAERCGFVLEGRLRNAFAAPGDRATDALVFSIVPGDPVAGTPSG